MADKVKKIRAPKEAKTTEKPKAEGKAKAPAKPRKTAARKESNPATGIHVVTNDQVAQLAHRYWLERGRTHGHDAEDWLRAEQELRGKAS